MEGLGTTAEGKGPKVRVWEEKGGDCGWRGREGSPGTCLGREGRRLWLEEKGREPRYVSGKRREETVAGGEGKGAQVRVWEEKGGDCGGRRRGGRWEHAGSTLAALWEHAESTL